MPARLTPQTITNVSADVINSILNSGSINYRDYIPQETEPNAESIREVGRIIMDSPNLRNNFVTDMINMVIKVYVSSKSYESPTERLKKGMLEMGETIEDIFVNMVEAETYDPDYAEIDVWKQRIPDIRAAFYPINYQVKYPVTIRNEQLCAAFTTQNGVYDLIQKIYQQLFTADAYDDFNMVKYIVAYNLVTGRIKAVPTTAPTTPDNVRDAVRIIKATSNKMKFMKDEYNISGVKTHVQHEDQTLLISADFDAAVDVEVLAAAFNMSKAEFLSKRLLVDSFGDIDARRLAACCPYLCTNIVYETADNGIRKVVSADLKYITSDQIEELKTVPAVLIDDDFIQEYDRLLTMEDIRNPSGLYTNAFYHVWRTYCVSPFAPAAAFDVTQDAGVTLITLTPEEATVTPGSDVHFTAAVTASGMVDQSVTWSIDGNNSTGTVIDAAGNLHIADDETAVVIDVFARSASNPLVFGSAPVTVFADRNISFTFVDETPVKITARPGELVILTHATEAEDVAADYDIVVSFSDGNIPFNAAVASGEMEIDFTMPNDDVTVTVTKL